MSSSNSELPALPPRPIDAHKGMFGNLLIVGGRRGMGGAVVLAARAAFRAGAGKVSVAIPNGSWPAVASQLVEAMTLPVPDTGDGGFSKQASEYLLEKIAAFDAVVIGPGFGRSDPAGECFSLLFQTIDKPLLIDADGLYWLDVERLSRHDSTRRTRPVVLTPHPGEMGRMIGQPAKAVQSDRDGVAAAFIARYDAVLLLKGYHTIIAEAGRTVKNTTGNPGMATAGMGDVLSGVIGALLAAGLDAFDAAQLGAWIHGRAGDIAAEYHGLDSLIASDALDKIPAALKELRNAGG